MARKKVVSKTRRANNEGSIFQRKDGRWTGAVTTGYDDNGKPIRKFIYGKSRMEVANKLTELTNRIESENFDYVDKNTIGSLMTEWLLVFKKNQVTPRTFEGNFSKFKLHIEPKIGNMKIDEVTTMVIQKLLNQMLEDGYSLDVVRKTKVIFNQFFGYAVQNKFVQSNPTLLTRVKSKERKIYDGENKYKAIPPEAREKFLTCLGEHKLLKPLCLCMMLGGLRTGETLGLMWKDIDLKNKTINVDRAITIVPKFDENGKITQRITVISETKTACSKRTVPMPDMLVEALKEYKINQEIKADEKGIVLTDKSNLVFCNDDGSLRTYYGTKKIFNRFLSKYNLNNLGIHFHTLRHTYSNMLFEADQNPKVIQALLGHKSVKTTITTYNSVDKSYFQKATDVLNNNFKTNESKETEEMEDDELDAELERLFKEKQERRRRKSHDFEM